MVLLLILILGQDPTLFFKRGDYILQDQEVGLLNRFAWSWAIWFVPDFPNVFSAYFKMVIDPVSHALIEYGGAGQVMPSSIALFALVGILFDRKSKESLIWILAVLLMSVSPTYSHFLFVVPLFLFLGAKGFGPERRRGLFGELYLLKELIFSHYGSDGLKFWSGPSGAMHDFEIGKFAMGLLRQSS